MGKRWRRWGGERDGDEIRGREIRKRGNRGERKFGLCRFV